ncbi:MAG: AAA family ATPase [Pseudobacter sp.]|uniref:AAA family ATPase n=1 Tax=Pseudobacter sp. TaxID=2045420 RepID=UPI003F7F178D
MYFLELLGELVNSEDSEGDVSILIGENGSGKSYMLRLLSEQFLLIDKKVIAISNSIYDKFPDQSRRNLHLLRDRGGRSKAKTAIRALLFRRITYFRDRFHYNAIEHGNGFVDLQKIKNASKALEYIGYDSVLGFERLPGEVIYWDEIDLIETLRNSLNEEDFLEVTSILYKSNSYDQQIIWLHVDDYSFKEIDLSSLLLLFKWEKLLKKHKILGGIKIHLRKNGESISLFEASSGELSFISSIIYLTATIEPQAAILIDEPENSLHPSWQKDYVKIILELFYLYQPKIVVATHSALIVTGAEITNSKTKVFECKASEYFLKTKEPVNIEEAFIDYFSVVTPKNRYLSNYVIELLNKLALKETTFDAIELRIEELKKESFDPDQVKMLDGVKELAVKIVERDNESSQI